MRDEIGKYLPLGIGVGFENEMPDLENQVNDNISELYEGLKGTVDIETAKTTTQLVTSTRVVDSYGTTNNSVENGGIPNGSTFILQNSMDSATIGETVYKVVDGKLALQRRRVR